MKKFILGISAVVIFTLGYMSFGLLVEQPTQATAANNETAAMQAEIAELRAMIQLLLSMLANQTTGESQQAARISSQQARDIAIEIVGQASTAYNTLLFTENGTLMFEVEVHNGFLRYMVYVDAIMGVATRMVQVENLILPDVGLPVESLPPMPVLPVAPPPVVVAPPPPTSSVSTNRNVRPANPPITRERAIEIAENDLHARGHSGTFRSVSLDWERGQWVWEVEFRSGRTEFEWYINVDTGAIVKFEIDWD